MNSFIYLVLITAWYTAPIYMANVMPIVVRRWCNWLAFPLDLGKKYKDQPIFGRNKTFRGLLVAVIAGVLIFVLQRYAYQNSEFFRSISIINYTEMTLWLGFLMGLGSILGDLIKSFVKRRFRVNPGQSWFPWDQMDYALGGMILGFFLFVPRASVFVFGALLGISLSIAVSTIGKFLGIRKSSW
ncbi:MAG: CDP-archaeol synthase [Patescibacteria group bacterium]